MPINDPRYASFPGNFLAAAKVLWSAQANNRLSGSLSSISKLKEESEQAALKWLATHWGTKAFLNETGGLESIVYEKVLPLGGKKIDLVAKSQPTPQCNELVLIEAKSELNSKAARDCLEKFETSVTALLEFYKRGNQPAPPIRQLVVTARTINISGKSSHSAQQGRLYRNNAPVMVAGRYIELIEIPF